MNYPVIPRTFFSGDCFDAYRILGAHPCTDPNGAEGWRFAVWAPGATAVEICGGFDGWERGVPMEKADTGVWSGFVSGLYEGELYKYRIHGADGSVVMRSDPYAFSTELRPGTYALMDASQGHAIGTLDRCAATVLATVISKPTDTRTILDVGAKGLTMQSRTEGICAVPGKGTLYDCPEVHIEKVFDEHAIILDRAFHDRVQIGQKVRVIPVHICPVCNLYDQAYLISGNDVVQMLPIAGRGKLQ